MTTLMKARTVEVEPDWSLFLVTGAVGGLPAGSVACGEVAPPDGRVTAGADGLVVRTVVSGQAIHLRFELWDGLPPEENWGEELWTGRLTLHSGVVCAVGWEYPNSPDEEFDLGVADAVWMVRVTTKILQNGPEPGFPETLCQAELYRVQFYSAHFCGAHDL